MPKSYVREQYEETPGYEGAAPKLSKKKLDAPATSVDNSLEPSPLERDDELRGSDEPLEMFEDEHAPTWGFSSRAYPDLLGFRLAHILGPPTTVVGDGAAVKDPEENKVPVGAYMHTWSAPFGPSGASPQTTKETVAYVDETTFIELTGIASEELTLSSDEAGGVKIAAKGPALFYKPIADPSITPTPESLAVRPFMRRNLKVITWQGEPKLLENFGVTINNPVEAGRSMATGSAFPDLMEKGDGPITVTIEAPKRHVRKADLEALQAATRFEVKALWQSASLIGVTSYPYRLWLQGDGAQYTGGGPASLENKRRIGATYQAKLTSDGVGASSKFTLVNATPEYVTF